MAAVPLSRTSAREIRTACLRQPRYAWRFAEAEAIQPKRTRLACMGAAAGLVGPHHSRRAIRPYALEYRER